jgi:hypothetical protein
VRALVDKDQMIFSAARRLTCYRGQKGEQIVGWKIDTAAFTATPQYYDNREGVPICLRGMFEAYDRAVTEDYFDEAAAAEADARDQVEREAARVRLGLPAR